MSLTKQLESAAAPVTARTRRSKCKKQQAAQVSADLDATRRQAESDLQQQEDEFELKVLELKESHAKHSVLHCLRRG